MKKFAFLSCLLVLLCCNLASAASVVLPQTGQTVCYDASGNIINCNNIRQDGAVKAGVAWPIPRFVDNGNNTTIGDKLTNLVWTKDADAPEYSSCGVPQAMNWQQALDYIGCLNTTSYLGVHDWALPNANQLRSLINLQNAQNAQWLTTAQFINVQNANYWTNDTFVVDPAKAWAISINDGKDAQDDKLSSENHVWPVRIAPDLVMTAVSGPTSVNTEQSFTLFNTVKNQGPVSASGRFYIRYYLSTDSTITTSDIGLLVRSVEGLTSGTENMASTTLTLSSLVESGTYYIGAIADSGTYGYSIAESDETNNSLAGNQITITKIYPDLVMRAVSGPTSANTEQQITVNDTVMNQGPAVAGGRFYVGYYLSTDATITTDDIWLPTSARRYDSMLPGVESTGSATVTIPSTVTSGTYYIGAIADNGLYGYSVVEADETNNSLAGNQITITKIYPDLVMRAVSGPTSANKGQQITVDDTVKNQGPAVAGSRFYVGYYLSTDTTITNDDIWLPPNARQLGSLLPGIESTGSTTVTIPNTVTSGTYYIGAIADNGHYGYSVVESDETNNGLAGNQIIIQ